MYTGDLYQLTGDLVRVREKLVRNIPRAASFLLTYEHLFVFVNDKVLDEEDHAVLNTYEARFGELKALKWYQDILHDIGLNILLVAQVGGRLVSVEILAVERFIDEDWQPPVGHPLARNRQA